LTFDRLRSLNPTMSIEQLSAAFDRMPGEMQEQCWAQLRLRVALLEWNADAEADREVKP
jgi:hypothetical protein